MVMSQSPLELFGLRVRELRLANKFSQEELAAITDLDRTYISGIERGKRNLSFKNILKVSEALRISPSELLDISGLSS
jgi:transcriptional regulator with XRE-family HTH domain